jgi:NADPH:quinone reductase-like Zn-dependent oxidoreductase
MVRRAVSGVFAVQLAHRAGVHVLATAGSQDLAYVRDLGAGTVLDGRAARFEDVLPFVDAVIDLVGGDVQARSFRVLKPGGTLISTVSPPDQDAAAARAIRAAFFLVEVRSERLARIAGMIEAGALVPSIGGILPLAELRVAHEMLDGVRKRPRGKLVLRVTR